MPMYALTTAQNGAKVGCIWLTIVDFFGKLRPGREAAMGARAAAGMGLKVAPGTGIGDGQTGPSR